MRDVHLYPDGSCLDNGLPSAKGGWGLPVVIDGVVIEEHLGKLRDGRQTNNRAEMEAFLQALLWIDCHADIEKIIHIHCDSEIVVNGITGAARRNANRDIWSQIEKLCERLLGKFTIDHEEGKTNEYNLLADKLAKQAANSLIIAPTIVYL
jgi:ribonuclease HI